MNLNQVTVSVRDIAASVAFYRCLGLDLIVLAPHYARFRCPEGGSTFSVHLAPDHGFATGATVVYFEVSRLDETAASALASPSSRSHGTSRGSGASWPTLRQRHLPVLGRRPSAGSAVEDS
jgi:catechol 2,3-dioxygenase-like lactoylglutathione lyase family enzyme